MQLLCFTLLSKLWDEKSKGNIYEPAQVDMLRKFFNSPVEIPLAGYKKLLTTLLAIFDEKAAGLPDRRIEKLCVKHAAGD
jgi:hypothetical protein